MTTERPVEIKQRTTLTEAIYLLLGEKEVSQYYSHGFALLAHKVTGGGRWWFCEHGGEGIIIELGPEKSKSVLRAFIGSIHFSLREHHSGNVMISSKLCLPPQKSDHGFVLCSEGGSIFVIEAVEKNGQIEAKIVEQHLP